MGSKIFVGNLTWEVTSEQLQVIVNDLGHAVRSARVVTDRETGRSRGFGFVELNGPAEAADAIRDLDGYVVGGRPLRVNEAEDKPRRGGGGGKGGRGRGGSERGGRGGGDRYEVWDD